MSLIYCTTMASTIRKLLSSGVWVLHQMIPDWFSQHGGQRQRLNRCWWRSLQWTHGAIWGTENSRTKCVNLFSTGSLCWLTENFILKTIIRDYWAVASEYWLINRTIVGKMNYLARYINFIRMRATSVRRLLCLVMPNGHVWIWPNGNH